MTDLVASLKRHRPTSLRAVLLDGTDRTIAVGKAGFKWANAQKTLDALDWECVECLDKDGRVIGIIKSPDEEAMDDAMDEIGNPEVVQLAKVLTSVMRDTMKETRQMFETQMKGQAALVESLISGVQSISNAYTLALNVRTGTEVAGDDSPEVMKMMQMAMMMLQQQKQPPSLPVRPPPPKEGP